MKCFRVFWAFGALYIYDEHYVGIVGFSCLLLGLLILFIPTYWSFFFGTFLKHDFVYSCVLLNTQGEILTYPGHVICPACHIRTYGMPLHLRILTLLHLSPPTLQMYATCSEYFVPRILKVHPLHKVYI